MKRHRQPLEIASDMNVTNLIDTSFILLITFMLVAPQLKHGIQLELPEVVAPPMEQKSQKVWEISITSPFGRSERGEESEVVTVRRPMLRGDDFRPFAGPQGGGVFLYSVVNSTKV